MIKTENPILIAICIALFVVMSHQSVGALGSTLGNHITCPIVTHTNNQSLSKSYAKTYARNKIKSMGWSKGEWKSLYKLWMRESKFDPTADNKYSTAYGIAQLLNTKKNSTIIEQVDAGLAYIKYRYKTPTRALWHHYRLGWY